MEIADLCEKLPPEKRTEVADFARFLLAQQQDDAWEAIIENPSPNAKLRGFLEESAKDSDKPLNVQLL